MFPVRTNQRFTLPGQVRGGAGVGSWEMGQRRGYHIIRTILSDFLLNIQVKINVNGFDGVWFQGQVGMESEVCVWGDAQT